MPESVECRLQGLLEALPLDGGEGRLFRLRFAAVPESAWGERKRKRAHAAYAFTVEVRAAEAALDPLSRRAPRGAEEEVQKYVLKFVEAELQKAPPPAPDQTIRLELLPEVAVADKVLATPPEDVELDQTFVIMGA